MNGFPAIALAATYAVLFGVTAWGTLARRSFSKAVGGDRETIPRSGICLMIVAVAGGIAHSLCIGFVSDDYVHLHFVRQYQSGLDAFVPRSDGIVYRPLPMFVWWLGDQLGLGAPGFKLVAWACAFGTAWMMLRILVLIGVGAAAASAAMAFWLASPATTEVAVWASNLYSSLSTLLATGGLLLLLRSEKFGLRTLLILAIWLSAAACKEDIALWPLLGFIIGLRRKSGRGVTIGLSAMSLAITLGLTLVKLRLVASGLSALSLRDHLEASAGGLVRSLQTTSLLDSLLPIRGVLADWSWVRITTQLVLAALWVRHVLQGSARSLGMVAALAVVSAIPVARFAPFSIEDSRLCYPISLASAAILSIVLHPLGAGRVRGGLALVALLALSLWNAGPWRTASRELQARVTAYREDLVRSPLGAVVVLYGMPDSYAGAYCFRNGGHLAAMMAARRFDISVQGTFWIGTYDVALIYDEKTGRSLRPDDLASADIQPGSEILWDKSSLRDPGIFRPIDSEVSESPDGIRVSAAFVVPLLMSPTLRLRGGRALVVTVDGEASLDGQTTPIPIILCTTNSEGSRREAWSTGPEIPLRPGTTEARLELACFPRNSLTVRSVSIRVR